MYAATFHPATASIIVTGGFDRVLRVWRREDGGTYTVKQVTCLYKVSDFAPFVHKKFKVEKILFCSVWDHNFSIEHIPLRS